MLSKTEIKRINSLSLKKFRLQHGLFCAEGDKIVNELIVSGWETEVIYATDDWSGLQQDVSGIPNIRIISNKELGQISSLTTPNKALALVRIPQRDMIQVDATKELVLALDNIQDPGNLGTIIRAADWFGVDKIICSQDTADVYNPKVIQATMGSFARVKLLYCNLDEFFDSLPETLPIMGAMLKGDNIFKKEPPKRGILVLGNESKGISDNIARRISQKLFIPMYNEDLRKQKPESLNVAMAAGIMLGWIRSLG